MQLTVTTVSLGKLIGAMGVKETLHLTLKGPMSLCCTQRSHVFASDVDVGNSDLQDEVRRPVLIGNRVCVLGRVNTFREQPC